MRADRLTTRLAVVLLLLVAGTGTALAQQLDDPVAASLEGTILPRPAPAVRMASTRWASPPLHNGLSASFVVLQVLDVASTVVAVNRGRGNEANPLVRGLADHPFMFGAIKGGVTISTVMAIRSLAKKRPKAAALTWIGLNAGYGVVVASNLRVITP